MPSGGAWWKPNSINTNLAGVSHAAGEGQQLVAVDQFHESLVEVVFGGKPQIHVPFGMGHGFLGASNASSKVAGVFG